MLYLGIKEMATISEDVIIVTSSLTKDMTGKASIYIIINLTHICLMSKIEPNIEHILGFLKSLLSQIECNVVLTLKRQVMELKFSPT